MERQVPNTRIMVLVDKPCDMRLAGTPARVKRKLAVRHSGLPATLYPLPVGSVRGAFRTVDFVVQVVFAYRLVHRNALEFLEAGCVIHNQGTTI